MGTKVFKNGGNVGRNFMIVMTFSFSFFNTLAHKGKAESLWKMKLSTKSLRFSEEINTIKGERNPNIKYVSQRKVSTKMNFDTSLIKIGQEITKLLVFEDFNRDDIGAAILNI